MGYDVLSQVDPRWHDEFRRFVASGKASDGFLQYFEETPACQEAAAAALAHLFSPFAEALHKEKEEEATKHRAGKVDRQEERREDVRPQGGEKKECRPVQEPVR